MGREFTTWRAPGEAGIGAQINSLGDFSPDVLSQLRAYFEQAGPKVPIAQQQGFVGFTIIAQDARGQIGSTAQTAYADLDTDSGAAGSVHAPYITNPPVGRYLVLYGATMNNTAATNQTFMCLNYNGVNYQGVVSLRLDLVSSGAELIPAVGLGQIDITDSSLILQTQYKVSAGTGSYSRRFMLLLKYGNLTT